MKTLNLLEAAAVLGVKRVKMLHLAASGLVPGAKISKAWVFNDEDLEAYLRAEIARQTNARRPPADDGRGAARPRRRRGTVPPPLGEVTT